MTTIIEVSDDLQTVLQLVTQRVDVGSNWRATGFIGEGINAPVLKVARDAFDPRYVFGQSKAEHTFTVTAYVNRSAGESGERDLAALCELSGNGSVIARIQTGANWSVTVDHAQVVNVGKVEPVEVGGAEYLALPFQVKVVW